MNAINKLDILRSSYKKQKAERNIPDYEIKEENTDLKSILKEELSYDKETTTTHLYIPSNEEYLTGKFGTTDYQKPTTERSEEHTQSNRILDTDEDFDDFLLSKSAITSTFNRLNDSHNLKDKMKSEKVYLDFSDTIKLVNISDDVSFEDSLKSIEDIFVKFIDEDSDTITNSHCVKIIALLINRLEDLNRAKYPLCSLTKTEEFVNDNLNIDDIDKLALFLDRFLETYMEEEMKSYELNKEEYYKIGKFEDFKKFQMSKIEKMNLVLEWLLSGETS